MLRLAFSTPETGFDRSRRRFQAGRLPLVEPIDARPLPDALIRRGKDLLVAYMPYKVHLHRILTDLQQPWVRGHVQHPFIRDVWRYVEVGGGR